MSVRSVHPSLSKARDATSKPEEAAPFEIAPSARRNSVIDFAATYSTRHSASSTVDTGKKPPPLVQRDSIKKAAGDAGHLAEVRLAIEQLNGAFDSIDDMDSTKSPQGAVGKYRVSPEGDMVLLNKIEIECAASEAINMLWDHRESSVTKIAGDIIASCEIKGTVNSDQRILYLRYQKPTTGLAGNTSARDASVLADKSAASGKLPMITFSSVTTRTIPPQEDYVRGDTRVLGFAVEPKGAGKCTIFFACEFAMNGSFANPLTKWLLKCTGLDKVAARNCSVDCNTALCRLRTFLELRAKK